MEIKIHLTETEISKIINDWFHNTNLDNSRFWERNPVAITIKENLQKIDRWPRKKRENKKVQQTPIPVPQPVIKPEKIEKITDLPIEQRPVWARPMIY